MTPELEQQLLDTVQSIKADVNNLTTDVNNLTTNVNNLTTDVNNLTTNVNLLTTDVNLLTTDVEKSNDKFSNYQQATQWVVQLAFSLIASATVIIIVSNVLNK